MKQKPQDKQEEPFLSWVKEWKSLLRDESLTDDDIIENFDHFANREDARVRESMKRPIIDDDDMILGTFGLDL